MPHNHSHSQPPKQLDSTSVQSAIVEIEAMVTEGSISRDTADGMILTLLSAAQVSEPGEVTRDRIALMDFDRRESIEAGIDDIGGFFDEFVGAGNSELDKASDNDISRRVFAGAVLLAWISRQYEAPQASITSFESILSGIMQRSYEGAMARNAQIMGLPAPNFGLPALRNEADWIAKSVINTWNNDVNRTLARILEADKKRGLVSKIFDRNYVKREMGNWAKARERWKTAQIVLDADGRANHLALQNYVYEHNLRDKVKFQLVGPPPKEEICAGLMAMGAVSIDVMESNFSPIHVGCPHNWEIVR